MFMDRERIEVNKLAKKKERGQYPAILIEQAWSIKDVLYGFRGISSFEPKKKVNVGEERSVLQYR